MRRRSGRFGPSRFISAMKVILPAIAILLLAMVTAWPQFKTLGSFRIELAAVDWLLLPATLGGFSVEGTETSRVLRIYTP